jgi:hypothetical protein
MKRTHIAVIVVILLGALLWVAASAANAQGTFSGERTFKIERNLETDVDTFSYVELIRYRLSENINFDTKFQVAMQDLTLANAELAPVEFVVWFPVVKYNLGVGTTVTLFQPVREFRTVFIKAYRSW